MEGRDRCVAELTGTEHISSWNSQSLDNPTVAFPVYLACKATESLRYSLDQQLEVVSMRSRLWGHSANGDGGGGG